MPDTDHIIQTMLKYNHLVNIVNDQKIAVFPEYQLDSREILENVTVAYKTWGTLNASKDNCMVICHAFTGSADVADWWGPLLGKGRAFDTSRFFVVCCNVLGSPYGSSSPLSINPKTNRPYGSEFPLTTIRDDVNLHRKVLDKLGVKSVAICIGGSLGGMHCLEWGKFGSDYVKNIIPIATSGKHSAWGISWGEAQRQMIYSDPCFNNGYYTLQNQPNAGLSVARMSALLTYRSRDSFETKFGRNEMSVVPKKTKATYRLNPCSSSDNSAENTELDLSEPEDDSLRQNDDRSASRLFSAQSYLRYQGDKFTKRFDANCYIALSKKMDTHDLGKGRNGYFDELRSISQPALIVGIETDGLFTFNEQIELATHIPNSRLAKIESYDGHDGFLLEFEQLNVLIRNFISENLNEYYNPESADVGTLSEYAKVDNSVFGESESRVSKW
ncbi:hypothetical protein BB561_000147 [Smittium simulii]|uniref:AB hydrolase-1 domain-containing protein n=1 Tax=Smittium simulii TaxID=133385 RepID=A0A2T9Z0B3_9FUNG|nr:hypothetical protein BB561_000147 [Smittium simulii]